MARAAFLSIGGFFATEIPLLVLGLLKMPAPMVLIAASFLACWFWLGAWSSGV
jgi:hypothetical protein